MRRPADLGFAGLSIEIAAPGARPSFEPPVDKRKGKRFPQTAFIIGDRVVYLPPGPEISKGERAWQSRLDYNRCLANRIGRVCVCRRHRITEIGRLSRSSGFGPIAEVFLDHRSEEHRVQIADYRDDGVLRAIPAVVECTDRTAGSCLQAVFRADRDAFRQSLASEQRLHGLLADALAYAAALALLGEDDRHLGANVRV